MTKLNQSNLQRDKYASISSPIELCGEMNLNSPMVAVCCINLDVSLISVLLQVLPRALQKASIMTKRGHNR